MTHPASVAERPWLAELRGDPLPWLLEDDSPAVRHLALRQILDLPENEPAVRGAQVAAMAANPIAAILAKQHFEGYWVKPGAGYSPKYTSTVWQLIFLDQLGADPKNPQVRATCEYVLAHTQAPCGGFGASGVNDGAVRPPDSRAIHCLNGNLLRALIGFGYLNDERVQRSIDWEARAITGGSGIRYYRSGACGPAFACAANDGQPCAWGAIKALRALARIPAADRAPHVERAIEQGSNFLVSHDPAKADYPMGYGNTKPSSSWFKLGFPSGYVADVLQNLEALCELGVASDPRLQPAVEWLLSKQDAGGRWKNEYAYNRKTWIDFERQGQPSKWVTLRACRVLKAVNNA